MGIFDFSCEISFVPKAGAKVETNFISPIPPRKIFSKILFGMEGCPYGGAPQIAGNTLDFNCFEKPVFPRGLFSFASTIAAIGRNKFGGQMPAFRWAEVALLFQIEKAVLFARFGGRAGC